MGWFTRTRPAPARNAGAAAAAAGARPAAAPQAAPGPPAPAATPLLHWLLGQTDAPDSAPTAAEQSALRALDTWGERLAASGEGLPRARSLLPHLLAMLRREDVSVHQIAEQVARDGALTAEVLRLARAAAQGGGDETAGLAPSISRLGRAGVNAAIARVLLRPLFDARGDGLLARASARLWQHSEAKAQQGSRLAAETGADPFEACLAALLHNSGWAVALHGLDREGRLAAACGAPPTPLTRDFAMALPRHCDRLFGQLGWDVTPGLAALAAEARAPGLQASVLPLALLLRRADAAATAALVGAAAPD